jgi:anaerobic selenocysteine-containing dehydrogenase
LTEHLSFCRICAAACGIVVSVEDDRVVRVRGDADHPVSRGYTCAKGRALPEMHHSIHRLDAPRVRGIEATWEDTLDELASTITDVIDVSGPDAVGLYLATGLAYDSTGQVASGMWMAAVGSSSFYTAATIDNAPVLVAAQLVAGNPMLNPVWEPDSGGLLVLIGTNPVVSHGYGTTLADPVRRIRDHRAAGGRMWVLDPRRTETAAHADEYLAVRPGSDVIVLASLVRSLLGDERCHTALGETCRADDVVALHESVEPFTLDIASIASGVPVDRLDSLVSALRSNHGRVAMFCGTGTTMSSDGILVEWLRWVLLIMTDSLDRPGGMRFNRGVVNILRLMDPDAPAAPGPASRPDLSRVAGQVPVAAMVDEIEAGRLRVLVVTGGNPLHAFPEPERLREALATLDALVVLDVVENDLAAIATHVLPVTAQLERADLSLAEQVAFRSGIQFTPAVVAPSAQRRPVWWILGSLADRLGSTIFGGSPIDLVTDESMLRGLLGHGPLDADEVVAAGPRGVDLDPTWGWVRPTMTTDDRWSVAPLVLLDRLARHRGPEASLVMVPRREMSWSNSVRCAGIGDEPVVIVHPEDAARAGVSDGTWVAVSSAHGSLVAVVSCDEGVRTGVVSVTHGHPGADTGALTSLRVDVDPLTAMPRASGLPVRLSPLGL